MNTKPSEFGGLFSCQRILVIGANGAGKTWMALRLAHLLDLPVTHNDALALRSGWVYRDKAAVRAARDKVANSDRWLIEGGPSVLSGFAFERAELILWLDPPRHLRLTRVMWRSLRFMGQQRPEHPSGNRDWPGLRQFRFIAKSWTTDATVRETIERSLEGVQGAVVRLCRPREVTEWLSQHTRD